LFERCRQVCEGDGARLGDHPGACALVPVRVGVLDQAMHVSLPMRRPDERFHDLTVFRMGKDHDAAIGHGGMVCRAVLNLRRIKAAPDALASIARLAMVDEAGPSVAYREVTQFGPVGRSWIATTQRGCRRSTGPLLPTSLLDLPAAMLHAVSWRL